MGTYRTLLADGRVRWLLGSSLVGRLQLGMTQLAVVLLVVTGHGSYTRAGVATGVLTAAAGVVGPVLGRAADRYGRPTVLVPAAVGCAAALAALAGAPPRHGAALFLLAALAGASQPPLLPATRSLWAQLLPTAQRDAMYSLEASLQELTFIAGPGLVTVLATTTGAPSAVITSGLCGLAGTTAFALHPAARTRTRARPDGRARARRFRSVVPLRVLGIGTLLLVGLAAVEVLVVGFAGHHHEARWSGLLLAVWSVGSLVGGLRYGSRPEGAGGPRRLAALFLGMAASTAVLTVAPDLPALGALLLVNGAFVAPVFGSVYALVARAAPQDAGTEAFAWLATALMAGGAVGSSSGGWAVQTVGVHAGFPLFALPLLAAAVLAAGAAAPGRQEWPAWTVT